jgi:hypothetical protein
MQNVPAWAHLLLHHPLTGPHLVHLLIHFTLRPKCLERLLLYLHLFLHPVLRFSSSLTRSLINHLVLSRVVRQHHLPFHI